MTIFEVLKTIKFTNTLKAIKPCDVLFFCHDVDRSISLNNQAYSPLIDSVRQEIENKGYTCISIAHPWSRITGECGYGEPVNINNYFLLSRIFGKIGFNLELKLYEKIIKKASPKLIITIGSNSDLCKAARDSKVFHAELLHGIGYTPMPWGWNKKHKENLPQCILSLDPVSTQTFSELEKKDIIVKEISHPFFKRFQSEKLGLIPHEWVPVKKINPYKKEILISLQWGYANGIDAKDSFKDILDNGLFYNEIEEVIKQTLTTVYWRFRLHPVHYRQPSKYKKQFELIESLIEKYENCEWRESTYIPLPGILMQCSGHITMLSMVSYEAAYVGVPTLALCPSLRGNGVNNGMFDDLVKKGYLLKQHSQVNSILEWVNDVEKLEPILKDITNNTDLVDWFFHKILNNG